MSNSANFKIDTRGIVNAVEGEDMATGDVKFWPSEVIPAGWLVRDGRALSRVAYAQLFAVLGTRYGAGDGATTFNIPDDRAEFIRGADMGRGVDAGRVVGSLQADELRSHGHDILTHQGSAGEGIANVGQDAGSWIVQGRVMQTGGVETRPRNRAYVPLIKY